jgi:hypothetical protein
LAEETAFQVVLSLLQHGGFWGFVVSSLAVLVPLGLLIYLIARRLKKIEEENFEKRSN